MKKQLSKSKLFLFYFNEKGEKVEGIHSGLRGFATGLRGDVTELRGEVSGICGDATGLRGNVDACEISYGDRIKGININDLILEK